MYADDTTLVCNVTEDVINHELLKVYMSGWELTNSQLMSLKPSTWFFIRAIDLSNTQIY